MTAASISRRRFLGGAVAATDCVLVALGVSGVGPARRAYAASGLVSATAASSPVLGTSDSLGRLLVACTIIFTTQGIWDNHTVIRDRLLELGATAIRDGLFSGKNGQLAFRSHLGSSGTGANLILATPAC